MKFSELPLQSTFDGSLRFPVLYNGANKSVKLDRLVNYLKDNALTLSEDEQDEVNGLVASQILTQAEYNAMANHNPKAWYTIVDDLDATKVWAVYRGDILVSYEPNIVGEFCDDSTEEDWYWWPNNVKIAIPVDPATLKFSYYWPGKINSSAHLFSGGLDAADKYTREVKLKRLERMPPVGYETYYLFSRLTRCEQLPVIDFRYSNGASYFGFICIQNQTQNLFTRLAFRNTERITNGGMLINLHSQTKLKCVTGLDFTSCKYTNDAFLSIYGPAYVDIRNLGMPADATAFNLVDQNFGDDSIMEGARQSLVDTLLTNSYNRAAAGYSTVTITLSPQALARLTASERSQITARGYTLTSLAFN